MDNLQYFPGLKRPVRELERFNLPSVKIMNKQSKTFNAPQAFKACTETPTILQLKMVGSFIEKKLEVLSE